ncbi:MAG: permease-like cell division protein FtsX [Cyanobacteria bacterium P01_C01_bin.89]
MWDGLTRWGYLWQETWRGFRRGGWMNWAAVATVAVSLFLLGTSLQASWHLERLLNQFGSQLEISVYVQPQVDPTPVQAAVEALPEVASVTLVSKGDAWEGLVKELGISNIEVATQQLEGNPLLDELKVKVTSPAVAPEVAAQVENIAGVEDTRYVAEVVTRLREVNELLTWVGLGAIALVISAAVATTMTTIRLVVAARSQEIEIMRLVGATRGWIYLPFLMQGAVFGLQGGVIAWGAIAVVQQILRSVLSSQPSFLQFLARELPLTSRETLLLLIVLLIFGTGVGLIASALAVRRTKAEVDSDQVAWTI